MRTLSTLLALGLMVALVPSTVKATDPVVVTAFYVNPDGFDADTPLYNWQSHPVLAISVQDESGTGLAAEITVFVEADDFNDAQLGSEVQTSTDDGLALVVVPQDIHIVGFVPGSHEAFIFVETAVGDVFLTASFTVEFP